MIAFLALNVRSLSGMTVLALAASSPTGVLAQTMSPVVPTSPAMVPQVPTVPALICLSGQPVPSAAGLGPEAARLWQMASRNFGIIQLHQKRAPGMPLMNVRNWSSRS
jgi:hypothetical protein